ncbi:Golgin candidate 4 [Apostasia shenzhenica]|uniref:Golgin candidate 4 n=1 Tax=Apostasia shenzhenica TaxID=1088818 RepID=A0A2I0B953_9ASPA|nr:Golgin candidate 4 [Apostasia shenzhenica]
MLNSIASYKESLSRIAHEVLDAAEVEVRENGKASTRRISQQPSPRSTPQPRSPSANGASYGTDEVIAKYRADIQKLQESEAEIKALSFNYAALLKEKEEQLLKLRGENGSLRRDLEVIKSDVSLSRDGSPRTSSTTSVTAKVIIDRTSIKPRRSIPPENSRHGNHTFANSDSKQNGLENWTVSVPFGNSHQNIVLEPTIPEKDYQENEKLLEEIRSLKAVQASHQAEMKLLKEQLENERANASLLKVKLQEEHQLSESCQSKLHDLKMDMEKISEKKELQKEFDTKLLELKRQEAELTRLVLEKEQNESVESLRSAMWQLEKQNTDLKLEKNELEVKLNSLLNMPEKNDADGSNSLNASKSKPNGVIGLAPKVIELEEMLKETYKERDKALQELSRLKQHLLDKELEEEDKMDEDSKIIEQLRTLTEYQKSQILQLENALRLERTKKEEFVMLKCDELHQSNEIISGLKQKLTSCMSSLELKNIELQNLQTALGQYYAESEAKERLGRELAEAREESAKFAESLKVADQCVEASKRRNEETNSRLLQSERLLSESRHSIQKLEDDNAKLRRALERSMTTLNRMSLDSDNYVDRRIVIKLLVTYFQRNHSKEVLDLMVRMLGFSNEDKQRVGFTQHSTGKGIVRGVLGLPGRLVGGIIGGGTAEASSSVRSESQSFADLWVDFLLKETERERRESSEDTGVHSGEQTSGSEAALTAGFPARASATHRGFQNSHSQPPSSVSYKIIEPSDAEFSTVPLTPVPSVSQPPKNSQPVSSQRY